MAKENKEATLLVIADGAALGPEVESLVRLKNNQNITIYLPESFEWLILKSRIIKNVLDIIVEMKSGEVVETVPDFFVLVVLFLLWTNKK